MAATEKDDGRVPQWVEYTVYAAALGLIFVGLYQLLQSHRIVLLERENYVATTPEPVAEEPPAEDSADTGA